MTMEEQIENLQDLGLIIENEAMAVSILNDVSYFRLIKAFSLGLKPKNGNYFEGVTFEQIVDLYKLNWYFTILYKSSQWGAGTKIGRGGAQISTWVFLITHDI